MSILLSHPNGILNGEIQLPGSKSESNRALILQALSGGLVKIEGLSSAQDSQTLRTLLAENAENMDVGHAGTAMRFLTAYLSFHAADKVLTGSDRMQERPIGPLVDALRSIGADIAYLGNDGFPPLMIFGRNAKFLSSEVTLPGNISSQYISALLLIACRQPDGLRIKIEGKIMSRPYIEMTLAMMADFGIAHMWQADTIVIPRQNIRAGTFTVEADWSAASYWFCLVALSKKADILLKGLKKTSLQGDHVVADKMAALGVTATWEAAGLRLQKEALGTNSVNWDFSDCPDLAQGLIVALAALNISGRFTGLESLRIKETDRILALQKELAHFGIQLKEEAGVWWLEGEFQTNSATIQTYEDHRMAMAFAPLALVCPAIRIENASVVSKSYPKFWDDLKEVGFEAMIR